MGFKGSENASVGGWLRQLPVSVEAVISLGHTLEQVVAVCPQLAPLISNDANAGVKSLSPKRAHELSAGCNGASASAKDELQEATSLDKAEPISARDLLQMLEEKFGSPPTNDISNASESAERHDMTRSTHLTEVSAYGGDVGDPNVEPIHPQIQGTSILTTPLTNTMESPHANAMPVYSDTRQSFLNPPSASQRESSEAENGQLSTLPPLPSSTRGNAVNASMSSIYGFQSLPLLSSGQSNPGPSHAQPFSLPTSSPTNAAVGARGQDVAPTTAPVRDNSAQQMFPANHGLTPLSMQPPVLSSGTGGLTDEDEQRRRVQLRQRLRALRAENRRLKERQTCRHCKTRPASLTFLPCGHFCYCQECGPQFHACPLCRRTILADVRTIVS